MKRLPPPRPDMLAAHARIAELEDELRRARELITTYADVIAKAVMAGSNAVLATDDRDATTHAP